MYPGLYNNFSGRRGEKPKPVVVKPLSRMQPSKYSCKVSLGGQGRTVFWLGLSLKVMVIIKCWQLSFWSIHLNS